VGRRGRVARPPRPSGALASRRGLRPAWRCRGRRRPCGGVADSRGRQSVLERAKDNSTVLDCVARLCASLPCLPPLHVFARPSKAHQSTVHLRPTSQSENTDQMGTKDKKGRAFLNHKAHTHESASVRWRKRRSFAHSLTPKTPRRARLTSQRAPPAPARPPPRASQSTLPWSRRSPSGTRPQRRRGGRRQRRAWSATRYSRQSRRP